MKNNKAPSGAKGMTFTFGRFQSPSVGHAKLIDKVKNVAAETGTEHRIYASKSHDNKKNPIKYTEKVKILRRMFPGTNIHDHPEAHTAFHVAKQLSDEGYKHVNMVVGQDRVDEFKKSIGKYVKPSNDPEFNPKKHYGFDSFNVISAGDRDENAKGVEGVSGTKLRQFAADGDFENFHANTPTKDRKLSRQVFNSVRAGLGKDLKETLDHKSFGPMLDDFTSFASNHLGLKAPPKISLKPKLDSQSFGGYNPETKTIVVRTKDRHPMDIYRTVAHELVHHEQDLGGKLKNVEEDGATGSDIENDANSRAGIIMRQYANKMPGAFDLSQVTEETLTLNEGLYDKGQHTAIFLAGGPGSGKDYVMSNTMQGHGLTELNPDIALEYLMKKRGLSLQMPEHEKHAKDEARGRAKEITQEKNRLALHLRKGVIINGTADDPGKLSKTKKELEKIGYKTMMVYVDTSNHVSKQRNIARGLLGGRTVPEEVRQEKWQNAQAAKKIYKDMFGPSGGFIHVDNSTDISTASEKEKQKINDFHLAIHKTIGQFISTPSMHPEAQKWREEESLRRGITSVKPVKSFNAFNKTTPVHLGSRAKTELTETNKPKDREWGSSSLVKIYSKDTPGENRMSQIKKNINDKINEWANSNKIKERFRDKYGKDHETKLNEYKKKLMESDLKSLKS